MAAVLLGVIAALCWSVHDLIARSCAERIGPFRMAAFVMVAGFLLLAGLVLWNGTLWQATGGGWGEALLLGLAYGLGAGGLFKAFSLGPVSVVAPLTAAYPVLVVLWGVWHGLSPTALQWSAILLTVLGAIVVGRSGHEDGGIRAVKPGQRLIFFTACGLSMLGYASSVVFAQNAAVAMGGIEAAFVSRPTALLILAPFALKERHSGFLTRNLWLGVLAMGALDVAGLIAVALSGHFPMKEFAAVGVSTYGATAVLLATLVLREKVAPGQWIGIVMIVAGVAALSITQA